MSHPLAPAPWLLCTADGAKCKNVKSNLHDASMSELAFVPEPFLPKSDVLQTYFLDLIACMRIISLDSTNRSIRSLAWQVVRSIPCQFTSIFLVWDTYCVKSIKAGDRVSRGQGKPYVQIWKYLQIVMTYASWFNWRTTCKEERAIRTTEYIFFQCETLPFYWYRLNTFNSRTSIWSRKSWHKVSGTCSCCPNLLVRVPWLDPPLAIQVSLFYFNCIRLDL